MPLDESVLKRGLDDDAEAFAVLSRSRLLVLSQALPTSAAVLLCLEWHAARQERMSLGLLARQRVCRISASSLSEITGKTIRTVRGALATLKKNGLIEAVTTMPGKTAIYRVL